MPNFDVLVLVSLVTKRLDKVLEPLDFDEKVLTLHITLPLFIFIFYPTYKHPIRKWTTASPWA